MQCPADETEMMLNAAGSGVFAVAIDPDLGLPTDEIFPGGAGVSLMPSTQELTITMTDGQAFRLLQVSFTVTGAETAMLLLIDHTSGLVQPGGPAPVTLQHYCRALLSRTTVAHYCRALLPRTCFTYQQNSSKITLHIDVEHALVHADEGLW